ncbi:hypothetical protein [Streptomyces sp. NPDC048157]|uniref:hypothetical protein n=1 Tax=Streptomyces sp. NPDC048157 TaxID=3365503 RepID=UPI00371D1A4C
MTDLSPQPVSARVPQYRQPKPAYSGLFLAPEILEQLGETGRDESENQGPVPDRFWQNR